MTWHTETPCSAFSGHRLIGSGPLREIAPLCKQAFDTEQDTLVILSDEDSSQIEVDFRGSEQDMLNRLPVAPATESEEAHATAVAAPARPGRPRLGVVAREVTLLPRHWEWLKLQPGGASVALRKLVESARHLNADEDAQRKAQGNAYRFISIMAGSLAGFEEASRALFAGNAEAFKRETDNWPEDVRTHAWRLAQPVLKDCA